MFRRLKLLQYLHEINLSPEETLALMRRLETDTCRPEDYEALIRIVRAHTTLSADNGWEAPPTLEQSASARRTSGQRQGAKRARRRPRR